MGYYLFIKKVETINSRLGIVFNPDNAYHGSAFYRTYLPALEERDFGVVQIQTTWRDLEPLDNEYNWGVIDNDYKEFKKRGWKLALVLSEIDGARVADVPEYYNYYDYRDEEYQERYVEFLLNVLEHYEGGLNYLVLGYEIDKYLLQNPDKIENYHDFYNYVYSKVKAEYPDVLIGTSVSYDNLQATNKLHSFLQEVNYPNDFIGFTYFNYDHNFNADSINKVDRAYQEILEVAAQRKIALVGVGHSALDELGSNKEQQKAFILKYIEFVAEHQDKVVFANYYSFVDANQSFCEEQANLQGVDQSQKYAWTKWFCSCGLLEDQETTREVWDEWQIITDNYEL